jgi:hypothetical protein
VRGDAIRLQQKLAQGLGQSNAEGLLNGYELIF